MEFILSTAEDLWGEASMVVGILILVQVRGIDARHRFPVDSQQSFYG
jgi:hypothetical protein